MMRRPSVETLFWAVLTFITAADVATKYMAHTRLFPYTPPHELLGNALRLTLIYNPGAAFGLHVGPYSRWIFLVVTLVALVIVGRLYRRTEANQWPRALALGLVAGGALGNLITRLWSDRGVVDFIDVGLGTARWPTFNVADIAVSVGAVVLAWVFRVEEKALEGTDSGISTGLSASAGRGAVADPHPIGRPPEPPTG